MIRGLAIIALGGAAFAAVAISASGAFHSHAWKIPGIPMFIDDDDGNGPSLRVTGHEPIVTRDLAWTGASRLEFEVPGKIEFTQGSPAKMSVTGPDIVVKHVVIAGDIVKLDARLQGDWHHGDWDHGNGITLTITAPALTEFDLESAQDLHIDRFDADALKVSISGAGNVTAAGRANSAEITVAGLGQADLSALTLKDARIEIDGLGHVKAGPTDDARVEINGAGAVTLIHRPAHLQQEINGAGTVDQPKSDPATNGEAL